MYTFMIICTMNRVESELDIFYILQYRGWVPPHYIDIQMIQIKKNKIGDTEISLEIKPYQQGQHLMITLRKLGLPVIYYTALKDGQLPFVSKTILRVHDFFENYESHTCNFSTRILSITVRTGVGAEESKEMISLPLSEKQEHSFESIMNQIISMRQELAESAKRIQILQMRNKKLETIIGEKINFQGDAQDDPEEDYFQTKEELPFVIHSESFSSTIKPDPYFPKEKTSKVVEVNGECYSVMLNQVNIGQNFNKFYIMQILKTDEGEYYFFCRWGRVGVPGQTMARNCISLTSAVADYKKKYKDKTKNGLYKQIKLLIDPVFAPSPAPKIEQKPKILSNLKVPVRKLIEAIFDPKTMTNQLKVMGYDTRKMPLGKLPKQSIRKCFDFLSQCLKEIEGQGRKQELTNLSSQLYSLIPHDFGFAKMSNFILDSTQKVKSKLEMLTNLYNFKINLQIFNKPQTQQQINQYDFCYQRFNRNIEPLQKQSQIYQKLIYCINHTHDPQLKCQYEVEEIFTLQKEQDNIRYTENLPNKYLLWYGQKVPSYPALLACGIRMPPPEAPSSAYNFGKGLYFSDLADIAVSHADSKMGQKIGLIMLCEVALGNYAQKYENDHWGANLPPGIESIKAVGKTYPEEGEIIEGAKLMNSKITKSLQGQSCFSHNAYVVYNIHQVKPRYLLQLKF